MNFANPTLLWWLWLVPGLVLLLVWAYRARRRALETFALPPLVDRLTRGVRPVARRWKAILLVAGIACVVVALARPRWGFEWRQVKHKGVDIFVLLDVSKSMWTEDVRPNRLTQAKFAVEDLLAKLQGDRVGLIAFAGTAFVQCPLTADYDAFRLALREADPKLIPRGGTAIGPAVRTALKAFAAEEGRDHAIVIITDGEQTDGDALVAAEEAAKKDVRIYTIGVGTAEGELIPVRAGEQAMEFLKDNEGKVVKSRLDEETLRQLALKTGGIYVRSVAGDFGMDAVYERGIAHLKSKEYEEQLQRRFFERFQWPLGLGLLLLTIEMFVSDRKRIVVLLALCCGGAVSQAAETSWPRTYNSGVTAYRSNEVAAAAEAFEKATATPDRALQQRAFYNLGNTTYRLGEAQPEQAQALWEKALKQYESALAIDPQDADAKFNHEFVKQKLEELKKKQEQQQQQKQDQKKDDQKKDDQQQPDKQQGQDDKKDQEKGDEQKPEEKPGEPQPQPDKPQEAKQGGEQQPPPPGNLDKQQAAALLDNLREEERNWNFFPEVQMKDLKESGAPAKDW